MPKIKGGRKDQLTVICPELWTHVNINKHFLNNN